MKFYDALISVKKSTMNRAKFLLEQEYRAPIYDLKTVNILSTTLMREEDEIRQLQELKEKEKGGKEKDVDNDNEE